MSNNRRRYTREEAIEASTLYFSGDERRAEVYVNKYNLSTEDGKAYYERTPDDMHVRLYSALVDAQKRLYPKEKANLKLLQERLLGYMKDFSVIVPQGSIMYGLGNESSISSLSNCVTVGDAEDSYGGIMYIDQSIVQFMKRRMGAGADLSFIRPYGAMVHNASKTSTGVVPYMERYSNTTREVAQDGRRGALMLTLSMYHPDIMSFVTAKSDRTKVTGANISVKMYTEILDLYDKGQDLYLRYPVDAQFIPTALKDGSEMEYDVLYSEEQLDYSGAKEGQTLAKYVKKIPAKVLLDQIAESNRKDAEPGILWWDNILSSPADCYGDYGMRTETTNPCSEIPMNPFDSCRLVCLNLMGIAGMTDEDIETVMKVFCIVSDLIVDLEIEAIDRILGKISRTNERYRGIEIDIWTKLRENAKKGRRTGAGYTGLADLMAFNFVEYGSLSSLTFVDDLFAKLAKYYYKADIELANLRGAFPIWRKDLEEDNVFTQRMLSLQDEETRHLYSLVGRRNINMFTIAPTGTTSMMTGTSGGVEPVFALEYKRKRKLMNPEEVKKYKKELFTDEVGDKFIEFNVMHQKAVSIFEFHFGSSPKDVKEIKDRLHYVEAHDVDPVMKARMIGVIQKYIDHSISVTYNLPKDTQASKILEVYRESAKTNKGVAIYVDGSRMGILSHGTTKPQLQPKNRPENVKADVFRFSNGEEHWIGFVGIIEGRPIEFFAGKADEERYLPKSIQRGEIRRVRTKTGNRYDFTFVDKYGYTNTMGGISHMFNKEYWNYARLISALLQSDLSIVDVIATVDKLYVENDFIGSWKSGVIRLLKHYVADGEISSDTCPNCGANLIFQEGCLKCPTGDFSKCG